MHPNPLLSSLANISPQSDLLIRRAMMKVVRMEQAIVIKKTIPTSVPLENAYDIMVIAMNIIHAKKATIGPLPPNR